MNRYDLPDVIQVDADGPIRIVRLNRPDDLNATPAYRAHLARVLVRRALETASR